LIIRVNSPGGTVTASDTIYHDIRSFKQRTKVPVYACITGIGASGGYYLATAADRISAHPAAVTGSIGVLFMKFGVEGLLSKVGVTEQTFKSADKKDIMSPFRPSTPEEERIMQGIIDSFADRFIDVVLARPNNRLSKEELKKLADGRIYTSDQAVRAGLIDGVEYLDDSVAAMKRKLGLEEAKVVTYFRPGSYRGSIYSEAGAESRSLGIININAGGLEMLAGPQFLYLWKP
jgi:protease-4